MSYRFGLFGGAALAAFHIAAPARADNAIAAQPPLDVTSGSAPLVPPGSNPAAIPADGSNATEPAAQSAQPTPDKPPPPPGPPEAKPIRSLGDAHWSDTLGFVQAGSGRVDADKGAESGEQRAPKVFDATLNFSVFRFGARQLVLNPMNDGRALNDASVNLLEVPLDMRFEWRRAGSLLVPWLDFGTAFWLGERELETQSGDETLTLGVTGFGFGLRFGMDVQPIEYVGAGPFIGGRADLYRASVESSSSTTPSEAEFAADAGLQYGLHARLRTRARPGTPSRLYLDPALSWKNGAYQTAQYAGLELGVRAGGVYFIGQYERRLSSSGSFTSSDVTTLSEAYAAAMPAEQRLGIALALVMAGDS